MKSELSKRIEAFNAMTAKDYDWEKHWENDAAIDMADAFRSCVTTHGPKYERPTNSPTLYHCGGSCEFSRKGFDRPRTPNTITPVGLYRLLVLCKPANVNFSDCYKADIFTLTSFDDRFAVGVGFWKYELGLDYYAPREAFSAKPQGVISGIPGSDNGTRITDPDAKAFFAMIEAVAFEIPITFYSGNSFSV